MVPWFFTFFLSSFLAFALVSSHSFRQQESTFMPLIHANGEEIPIDHPFYALAQYFYAQFHDRLASCLQQDPSYLLIEVAREELLPGDILFFGPSKQNNYRLGIYIGRHHFIYSSFEDNLPRLYISNLLDPEWQAFGRFPYQKACRLQQDSEDSISEIPLPDGSLDPQ